MKKLLFLVTFIFGSASFAAQITWSAYIVGDKAGLFAGGTGYLVKTSTTTDASVITSALQNSGIITDPDTLGAKGYIAFTDSSEIGTFQYDSADSVAGTPESVATAAESIAGTANYFVVVLSKDQTSYAVTDVTSITIPGEGIYLWTPGYDQENGLLLEDVFHVGSVGTVPEPTVLALLALGVAGIALKRKKVVA